MRLESPLFILNALSRTTQAISRSLERLSTGSRINSPLDDIAGFSESVNLESQIRGTYQSIRNLNDGLSLLLTAQGAISSQIEIVQKMREIAVQSSSGTLSTQDRSNLNSEVQQLYSEFIRIASTTQFNGMNLLDGSFASTSIQSGTNAGDTVPFSTAITTANASFTQTLPTGTYSARKTYIDGNPGLRDVVTGDVNGDGNQDVVEFNSGGASGFAMVYLGSANGTLSFKGGIGLTDYAFKGRLADVNGDGKLDLVTADVNGSSVSVYLGNGDGSFKSPSVLTVGSNPYDVSVADLNGDGNLDIVSAVKTSNTISVFYGNGNGTFQSRQTLAGTGAPYSIRIQDVNGDGKPDILEDDLFGGLNVYLGNGNGTFRLVTNAAAIGGFDFQLADINRDGKLDLVVAGSDGSNTYVQFGNGDGTFQSAWQRFGYDPRQLQVADMNGDGIPDIVGPSLVAFGNGDGTFKLSSLPAGSSPWGVAVADMNKDGAPDIVTGDAVDSVVSVYLGQLATYSAASAVTVATQTQAQTLLGILDQTLTYLKGQQSNMAAEQERMQFTVSGNSLLAQNLSEAKSSLSDVDIAAETSQLVRNQILEQAQVAALTQANLQNELILKLLPSSS